MKWPRSSSHPYVLNPAELDGLLRVGEALANISDRLSAIMGRPGGPLPAELRQLAVIAIDLLDVAEPDPDLEPTGDDEPDLAGSHTDLEGDTADEEPSLGWLHDGHLARARGLRDLDCEEDIAHRLHDADGDLWHVPPHLDVFAEPLSASPEFLPTPVIEGATHD